MANFVFKTLSAAALLAATVVAWDPAQKCTEFQPAGGECAIISFAGVGTIIGPGGIENELSDQATVLLRDDCSVIDAKDWEPQNPGFRVEYDVDGKQIVATSVNVGADAIATTRVTLNGNSPDTWCAPTRSFTEGISAVWFAQCNFVCS